MKFKKIINFSLATILGFSFLGGISHADNINLTRIEGQNRYETAINVSKQIDQSDYVLLASGEGYADALIGGTLASQEKAPLLLTEKSKLSKGISSEINRLNPKEVFILGGENTLSKNIEKEISSLGFNVTRLAGHNRIETAEKIAQQRLLIKSKTNKVASTSIEAGVYGYNFPDALVAGPLVGLYNPEKDGTELAYLLPEGNKDNYSKEYNWYFGGYNNSPSDSNVFAGKNRYETSISVANAFKNVLNKNFNTTILVNGENYPDALSASVLSAKYNAPILLTPSKNVYQNLTNYIKNNNIKNIIVVGGNNSINSNVANTYAGKTIAPTPKPVLKPTDKPTGKPNTNVSHETIGGIIHGNRDSGIYHVPGQRYYNKIKPENLRFFNTEAEAIRAGYRKSKI